MVPKMRKVKGSPETSPAGPTLSGFRAGPTLSGFRAGRLWLLGLSSVSSLLRSGACIPHVPSPVMYSSEWCSGGSLSLKTSLWPGLMTAIKDLLVGTWLSSGEKQTEAFKPLCGHLLPLTLQGLCILTSSALLVNDNYKCPRGTPLRQAASANWAQ